MTSHPRDMDDDLIAAHGDMPALMPYVHLPVQSGSDRILAAMNRRHTRRDYLDAIARLRAAAPISRSRPISSSAFPARPKTDFRDTLTLVDEVGFASAYSFMYSPRPGTPAAEMDDQVPEAEKSERLQRLQAVITRHWQRLQRAISRPHAWTCCWKSPAGSLGNWSAAPHICRRCR